MVQNDSPARGGSDEPLEPPPGSAPDDCLPRVSIVTRGRGPRVTMLTRGRLSCWQPHRDVIFVLLYRAPPPPLYPRAPKIHDKLKLTKLTWAVQFRSSRFTMLTILGCPMVQFPAGALWPVLGQDSLFHIASVYPPAKWVPSINKTVLRARVLYAASCSGISTGGLKWFPCVQTC